MASSLCQVLCVKSRTNNAKKNKCMSKKATFTKNVLSLTAVYRFLFNVLIIFIQGNFQVILPLTIKNVIE